MILAIDPGPTESAYVQFNGERIVAYGKVGNDVLFDLLRRASECGGLLGDTDHLAIEMVASYGLPVGAEVFDTCVVVGRCIGAWRGPYELVYRKDVKMHLCHQTAKVNDAVIRQALIDRFGPEKRKAIGTKMAKGPLFGLAGDEWQALAVAVYVADKRAAKEAA